MQRHPSIVFASVLTVLVAAFGLHAAPLTLVSGGTSQYRIYCDATASASVQQAAREIQRVIMVSTGVELPLSAAPVSPMIAVGNSALAAAAGLRGTAMPFEGYRILTRGADLFVVGHDLEKGEEKWYRQWSWGTLYGAYTFLEKVVGARWLMPGEIGEDIPRHTQLVAPELDINEAPCFQFRALAYVQGRYNNQVKEWKVRHKVHQWYRVSFPHVFDHFPAHDALVKHPEYMAMGNDGVRQPVPEGETGQHQYCLTDPGLQDAFAESVMAMWERRPERWHGSMSPNDSSRFCECPRCSAITERDDRGLWGNYAHRGWSITPALLQFYNAVGRHVSAKYPDRIVGGHIYRSYTYPPREVVEMAPNVILNLAVLDHYGYKLYKPARAAEFRRLYPAWATFTSRLAHTDYSTWLRDWYGIPLPPGRPILKLMFPILKQHKVMLVNYTGHSTWGTGAIHNYIVAKLLWDGDADVDALYDEFLARAYGPAAAPFIDRLYTISERALSQYVRAHEGFRKPSYDATHELVAKYYAPHFREFEELYSAAHDAADTPRRRQRLEMLGDVLTLLYHNLQCARLVAEPEPSRFHMQKQAFDAFMAARKDSIVLGPQQKPTEDKPLRVLFSPESSTLLIPFVKPDTAPPAIDGRLDDAVWGEAGVVTGFRLRGSPTKASEQTEVRLLFDREHLYVGVRCCESAMDAVKAVAEGRDSTALFDDDTVEVFIGQRTDFKDSYWHIAFNANGAWYDNVALERDYNLEFKHAVHRGVDGWDVEIAVPLKNLGVHDPPLGKSWRGNFCRNRKPGVREVSSWASIEDGFHEPANFGVWRFAAQ